MRTFTHPSSTLSNAGTLFCLLGFDWPVFPLACVSKCRHTYTQALLKSAALCTAGSNWPIRIPHCHLLAAQLLFSTNHRPSPRQAHPCDRVGGRGGAEFLCLVSGVPQWWRHVKTSPHATLHWVNTANLAAVCVHKTNLANRTTLCQQQIEGQYIDFFCFCLMFLFISKLSFISGKRWLSPCLCAKHGAQTNSIAAPYPEATPPWDVCACHLMFSTLASHQRENRWTLYFHWELAWGI